MSKHTSKPAFTLHKLRRHARKLFVRRQYRDELFRYIFASNKKFMLELYNAVNETDYTDESLLTVYTIENVIYMGYKNDLSFLVCGTLNLYEHQSSANPNMPLRGLFYFSRQLESYVKQQHLNIYGSTLVKIPFPQYIVFYNGPEEWIGGKDRITLSLSDAFEKPDRADIEPCLECRATVYNINYGHNTELMKRCRPLEEYAIFIRRIAEFLEKGYTLEEAIEQSVEDCINEEILSDFLIKHRAEVVGMILEEFDMKEFLSMTKRDERKEGYEAGVAAGVERGRSEGLELGIKRGRAAGIEQGRSEGLELGIERGRSEGISALISTCQDLGLSKEKTTTRLADKFHFSQEEATELMKQYWKE